MIQLIWIELKIWQTSFLDPWLCISNVILLLVSNFLKQTRLRMAWLFHLRMAWSGNFIVSRSANPHYVETPSL